MPLPMTLLAIAILVWVGKNGIAGILTYMHACSYIQSFPPGYVQAYKAADSEEAQIS